MLRFIVWMIIFFVAAKITGRLIRYVRLQFTPNKEVLKHDQRSHGPPANTIEDIPYEEIKEK